MNLILFELSISFGGLSKGIKKKKEKKSERRQKDSGKNTL